MIVKFENHGDLIMVNRGSFRLQIPTGAGKFATEIPLPDTDDVARILSDLTEKHPTLTILEDEVTEGGEIPLQIDDEIDTTFTFEDFKGKVSAVIKGGAGWWTVQIDGLPEPVKVRGAESEEDAMRLAFEDYVEDFS